MARHPAAQFLTWLYTRLLRLYPPRFREKFGPEMLEVFQQAAAEQARTGAWPLVRFALGEIGGLLPAVISLRRWKGAGEMAGKPEKTLPAREPGLPAREIFLGLLPLILAGLAVIVNSTPFIIQMPEGWLVLVFLLPYPAIIAGCWWGWQKGFPRWADPYPVYALFHLIYFSLAVSFNVGWAAVSLFSFLVLAPVGGLIILARRSGKSLVKAVDAALGAVWQDWTRLVFAFYGFLPLIIPIFQDETGRNYRFPVTVIAIGAMLVCAVLYVATTKSWLRAILAPGGLFLSMWVAAAGSRLYWATHDINIVTNERTLVDTPVPWRNILTQSMQSTALFTLGLLALPALVGFLHWLSRSRRSGSSGAGA